MLLGILELVSVGMAITSVFFLVKSFKKKSIKYSLINLIWPIVSICVSFGTIFYVDALPPTNNFMPGLSYLGDYFLMFGIAILDAIVVLFLLAISLRAHEKSVMQGKKVPKIIFIIDLLIIAGVIMALYVKGYDIYDGLYYVKTEGTILTIETKDYPIYNSDGEVLYYEIYNSGDVEFINKDGEKVVDDMFLGDESYKTGDTITIYVNGNFARITRFLDNIAYLFYLVPAILLLIIRLVIFKRLKKRAYVLYFSKFM